MKKTIVSTLVLFLFIQAVPAMAQTKTVTINGKVTSFEESLPLEGVSITVKGSTNSTGTQADGTFSLSVSSSEKVLLLRLPGYEKKEIPITNAREYDIILKRTDGISYQVENTLSRVTGILLNHFQEIQALVAAPFVINCQIK